LIHKYNKLNNLEKLNHCIFKESKKVQNKEVDYNQIEANLIYNPNIIQSIFNKVKVILKKN
jgi:hypothetical protein